MDYGSTVVRAQKALANWVLPAWAPTAVALAEIAERERIAMTGDQWRVVQIKRDYEEQLKFVEQSKQHALVVYERVNNRVPRDGAMAPSAPGLPLYPSVVTLSEAERAAGSWSRANIQRIVELMHRDGLCVLDGIVPMEPILKLRAAMKEEAARIKASKTKATDFNHGVMTNFLQSPPMTSKELLFPEVYSNDFAVQAIEAYIGKGVAFHFLTANTAIAGTTGRQNVHKDSSFESPTAPYMTIINYLLDDFKPSNGSTEFWLGSHACTTTMEQVWTSKDAPRPLCDIAPHLLDERRATRPPVQIEASMGQCLLRDPRVWHAGVPNPDSEDRIMIAIGYSAPWFPRDTRFFAPETAKPLLTSRPDNPVLATFLPDDEWEAIAQKWGVGEPMCLAYAPNQEGWTTECEVDPEKKYVRGA